MQYRGTYKGLEEAGNVVVENRVKKVILIFVFFITFISTVLIFTSKTEKKVEKVQFSKEEIKIYIDLADELSKSGYQFNWQEVVALNVALNNGNYEINNENINNIEKAFVKKDNTGKILEVSTFEDAMKNLNFSNSEEDLANKILSQIKGNYINNSLVNDSSKLKFIDDIYEVAIDNYKNYKVLPSITISQAILESGWGGSTLSSEYNNLFGIKADSRWNGEKVELETKENYEDVIVSAFRAYDDFNSSIKDHGKFLYENERYAKSGFFEGKTYKEQAQALEDAGYSTAKDEEGNLIYADKLIRVIQENNLMLYDTLVERK